MRQRTAHPLFRSLATLMLVASLTVQPVVAGLSGCATRACGQPGARSSCCRETTQCEAAESEQPSCCNIATQCEQCRPAGASAPCRLLCDCGDGQNSPATPPSDSSPVESLRFFDMVPAVDTHLVAARPETDRHEQDGHARSSTFPCGVYVLNCVWQT